MRWQGSQGPTMGMSRGNTPQPTPMGGGPMMGRGQQQPMQQPNQQPVGPGQQYGRNPSNFTPLTPSGRKYAGWENSRLPGQGYQGPLPQGGGPGGMGGGPMPSPSPMQPPGSIGGGAGTPWGTPKTGGGMDFGGPGGAPADPEGRHGLAIVIIDDGEGKKKSVMANSPEAARARATGKVLNQGSMGGTGGPNGIMNDMIGGMMGPQQAGRVW